MTDQSAAQHLVTAYNAMPRLQAAVAAGDDTEIINLCLLAESALIALRAHARKRKDEVPAVERPMVAAYFPGQY